MKRALRALGAQRDLACRCYKCVLDLRFDDKDDEAAYTKSLEDDVLRWHCIGAGIIVLACVVNFFWVWWREAIKVNSPFVWSAEDPRTVWFVSWIFFTVCVATMWACVLARIYLKRFRSWNWEKAALVSWTVATATNEFLNQWYWPLLCGHDPYTFWGRDEAWDPRAAWVELPLLIDLGVTMVGRFIPIRAFQLVLMPLCCIVTMACLDAAVGPAYPSLRITSVVLLLLLSMIALCGARQHERYTRKEWLASQRVKQAEETMNKQRELIEEQHIEIKEFEHGHLGELPGTISSSIQDMMSTGDMTGTRAGTPLTPGYVPEDRCKSNTAETAFERKTTRSGSHGSTSSATEEGSILNLKPAPSHGGSSGEAREVGLFDGCWEVDETDLGVSDWLASFRINGKLVVCGDGKASWLSMKKGSLHFEGGKLYLEGDTLHRVKKSSHLTFHRVLKKASSALSFLPVLPPSREEDQDRESF